MAPPQVERVCICLVSQVLRSCIGDYGFGVLVFNATFNNISVISWWSVLLVRETRVSGEIHRPAACHRQTLSHNVVSSTSRHERDSN